MRARCCSDRSPYTAAQRQMLLLQVGGIMRAYLYSNNTDVTRHFSRFSASARIPILANRQYINYCAHVVQPSTNNFLGHYILNRTVPLQYVTKTVIISASDYHAVYCVLLYSFVFDEIGPMEFQSYNVIRLRDDYLFIGLNRLNHIISSRIY